MSTNTDLIKKYNVPGPRYTSYPTVPYWETTPTLEQWIGALSDSIESGKAKGTGAAIYMHIPFCESLCTYCGCNTRITRNHGVARPYIETILKEWSLYLNALGKTKGSKPLLLSELHLGGGTPTFLTPEELKFLLGNLLETVELHQDHELSIEVDPRVTHREHLLTLQSLGFTRISMGIQDFDPKVQDIVHRVQSVEQVRKLTEQARELGFNSINYDLIYGLPLQTLQSVEGTIEKVISLKPDRIAFYAYAHVPWIKASQRRFTEADLPSGDEKRALYERGRELLEQAGYLEIGMDHFALKTDSLSKAVENKTLHRNFMGYTSRMVAPIIPLGVSAIGDAWSAFMQNEKFVETYQERVNKGEIPISRGHVLTEEDQILRQHVLNLMTQMETHWGTHSDHSAAYTPYLDEVFGKLEELKRDELLDIKQSSRGFSIRVSESGRAFLRNVCMAFDARLARKAPATRLFSQTQ